MLINRHTSQPHKPVFHHFKNEAGLRDLSNFTFDWKGEIRKSKNEVWGLTIKSINHILAYLSLQYDQEFLIINLMERERYPDDPMFYNIGQVLISYACLLSVDKGLEGAVTFYAKTNLIDWYSCNVYAKRIGSSNKMVILNKEANKLIKQYLE